jgi:hypothetical protein
VTGRPFRIVKDTYWRDRIARLGAAEAFRIADELRRQALAAAPSWPEPDERRETCCRTPVRTTRVMPFVHLPSGKPLDVVLAR